MYFNEDFLMRNDDNMPFAQAFSTTKETVAVSLYIC